ncbi:hypothetical protein WA158_007959 [Blastocystis sp. Blastoise]
MDTVAITQNNDLELILNGLITGDNERRNLAERALVESESHTEEFILGLVNILKISTHSAIRSMAAVLLRQKLFLGEDPMWNYMPENIQQTLKKDLLIILDGERQQVIKEKICDIISELGNYLLADQEWPELIPCLFSLCQSPDPSKRVCSLRILGDIASFITILYRDDINRLKTLYMLFIQQRDYPMVQIETFKALSSLIINLQPIDLNDFFSVIPLMLKTLSDFLCDRNYDAAIQVIQTLIDILNEVPTFFNQNLESIISAMISIAGNTLLTPEIRKLSLELLVLLSKSSPTVIRSFPPAYFIQPVLDVIFPMLVDIEEEPDWEKREDEPIEDTNSLFSFALTSLDQIAQQIRGKKFLPHCYALIEQFLSNDNWRYKYAAMYAISDISEFVSEETSDRAAICNYVISLLDDPHPRVRFASIYCLGQLSTDFSPYLQTEVNQETLSKLFSLLNPSQPPRIRYITAAALSNFVDECEDELLKPVLSEMNTQLINNLSNSPPMVQTQIFSVISSIAGCVTTSFIPYYKNTMTIMKQLYINPPFNRAVSSPTDIRLYRGQALECITIVGMAVGSLFKEDAREIMEIMYKEGMGEIEGEGEEMKVTMMQAWSRMCTALKGDFLPYVDVIIPLLLKTANMDYTIEEDEIDTDEEDEDVIIQELDNGSFINIRTNALDEKANACETLCVLLTELHENIYTYLEDIVKVLVPLLNTITFYDLCLCALSIMEPALITVENCVHKQLCPIDQYKALYEMLIKELLVCLEGEEDLEMLTNVSQIMTIVCNKSTITDANGITAYILSDSDLERILTAIKNALYNSIQRRSQRLEGLENEPFDEEEEEDNNQAENAENVYHLYLSECIGGLFRCYGSRFLPIFDRLYYKEVLEFTQEWRSNGDKKFGLFVIDDIIEHCGSAAYSYYPQFLPILFTDLKHPDPALRQGAAYGIGILAKYGGETFESVAESCILAINDFLGSNDVDNPDYYIASDNAVSAFGKILYYHPSLPNMPILFNCWLSCLPLHKDIDESDFCISILCERFEKNNYTVQGDDFVNISQILTVVCLSIELVKEGTMHRILQLVFNIQNKIPQELLLDVWNTIGLEKSNLIKTAMSFTHH